MLGEAAARWRLVGETYGLDDAQIAELRAYERLLVERGIPLGILGPNEAGRVLRRHIADSLKLLKFLPAEAFSCVDVGSGGGLPGGVVGLARPDARMTLVEASKRRCEFLRDVAGQLEADWEVICDRAETYGRAEGRERFDVALSRAVGEVSTILEYCMPLTRVGGRVLGLRGGPAADELARARSVSEQLGGSEPAWTRVQKPPGLGAGSSDYAAWIVEVEKVSVTSDRYPRRPGIPSKRPLR